MINAQTMACLTMLVMIVLAIREIGRHGGDE